MELLLQISNRDRCARGARERIEARGAPTARRGTSLTTEEQMMGAPAGAPETAPRDDKSRGATSPPGVVGLRARLKPERFWFDSRGWDHADGRRRVGSRMVMHRFLTPRDVGSIPTRPTKDQRTRLRAPTPVRHPGLARAPAGEAAKQVKCCGDTPVRHTGIRGFNSPHLLRVRFVSASTSLVCPRPSRGCRAGLCTSGSSGTWCERRSLLRAWPIG